MNDQEIIDGLRRNNSNTIEYVYRLLGSAVCRYVLNNSGTREDAKDLFQETFAKVWLNIRNDSYTDTNFEAYFIRIAQNTWKDVLRKKKVRKSINGHIDDNNALLVLLKQADNLDEEAIIQLILYNKRFDCLNEVWEEWNETPCQDILDAHYHQDKSYIEIAVEKGYLKPDVKDEKEIKSAQNKVGTQMLRCRNKLRTLLTERFPQHFKPNTEIETKPKSKTLTFLNNILNRK